MKAGRGLSGGEGIARGEEGKGPAWQKGIGLRVKGTDIMLYHENVVSSHDVVKN